MHFFKGSREQRRNIEQMIKDNLGEEGNIRNIFFLILGDHSSKGNKEILNRNWGC